MKTKEFSPYEIDLILKEQRKYFDTQITKNIAFRMKQLKRLKMGIKKYEEKIIKALYKDLGKHEMNPI